MTTLTLRDVSLSQLLAFLKTNADTISDDIAEVTLNFKSKNPTSNQDNNASPEFYDFTQGEFFGMWADREEMADSVEYIRKLRREQWG